MIFKQLKIFFKNAKLMQKSEKYFFSRKHLVKALPTSPARINIPERMKKYQKKNLKTMRNFKKILPIFSSIMRNTFTSYNSIDDNPGSAKNHKTIKLRFTIECLEGTFL
ncbi:MAG: hypothetical protein ACTSU9_11470 [Promethearchaeota archaeon]